MRILNQSFETVPVSALRKHPDNPRKGDAAAIAESIAVNGFYGAVVAQRSTGYVLAGNHRLDAVQAAGGAEIPVFWLDVNDRDALRILLADNRTSDLGVYDERGLAELLNRIQCDTGSLDGTGYDQAAFDAIVTSAGNAVLAAAAAESEASDHAASARAERLRFKVVVGCKSEENRKELIDKLKTDGYSCRAE